MSRLLSLSVSLSLAALVSACGASDTGPRATAPRPQPTPVLAPSSSSDVQALCVEVFTRNRTCTDQYIPALVDLRAKYDVPAGIAAEVAADRNGVIAQAKSEWATDSQPAAIAATCAHAAANPGLYTQSDIDEVQACLAVTDCAGFTTCILPQFEKRFAK